MPIHETWNPDRAAELIAGHVHEPGPLLPILHAVQEAFGHVPADAVPLIAEALNLSRAEVHGVVTFYHDFRSEPAGRRVLKLCRSEACQSMGAEALAKQAEANLATKLGDTTPDGRVTIEPIYCLGLCACAPAAMLDGELIGRLDSARLETLLTEAQS
jgi:formate dehydrogenase subunit gamma